MKVAIHYCAFIIAISFLSIYGCSKGPVTPSSPVSSPSSAVLHHYMPGIDTCTLWLTDGHNIGGYARISSATGKMIFHGYSPFIAIDSFILHFTVSIPDTIRHTISDGDKSVFTFTLNRAGVDTVVSTYNYIGIDGVGTAHPYYYMLIDGGNLPSYTIGRGLYIDTL